MVNPKLLEAFDSFSGLRNRLRALAGASGEWAGIPLPLEGEKLVLSPRYPLAELFNKHQKAEPEEPDVSIRNIFHSSAKKADIVIYEAGGKVKWGWLPAMHHFSYDIHTLGCSFVWGIEQEHHALQLLGELVTHIQLKQYLLTGMFLEKSERSGVTYAFRKLKPTVALVADDEDSTRILCTLCLHPLGYYEGSWAGAMCPTDDVVAHLILMRGDEHAYWKQANQHAPWRPEAGL